MEGFRFCEFVDCFRLRVLGNMVFAALEMIEKTGSVSRIKI